MNVLLRKGERPTVAIAKSLNYLAIPLLASTLTTILTFLPIILLPGDTGEFVRGIGLSVIAALVSFLAASLVIVPALVGRTNRRQKSQDNNNSWWHRGISFPSLTRIYRLSLDLVLAKPKIGILLALIIPVTGFVMSPTLPLQMFSPVDRERFYVEFELAPQASIAQTETTAKQARNLILESPEVVDVQLFLGKSPPELYYNTDR